MLSQPLFTTSKCRRITVFMLSLLMTVVLDHRVSAAENFWVYVGTYTQGSDSEGIYQLRMDGNTGKLSHVKTTTDVVNPSFLAIHPSKRYLYAVNEIGHFKGKKTGAVSSFQINAKTGALQFLNQQSSEGAAPCHLVVDATGNYVLVANYSGGNVCSLPIQKDGTLKKSRASVQHFGSSIDLQRQTAPHAHSINLDHSNRHAIVADLGIDQLLVYKFDPADGAFNENPFPGLLMAPGAGPRHFTFHPTGKWGYVINELNRTITAMNYDPKNGSFQIIQTISTVPEGTRAKGNSTAEIQVHPSGKFLYGSNRGPNTIAMYQVNQQTGKLTSIGYQPTGGAIPRNFKIDPTGKYLLVANQNTHTVVVFQIDSQTGLLKETGIEINVPKPVCIKFLPIPTTP